MFTRYISTASIHLCIILSLVQISRSQANDAVKWITEFQPQNLSIHMNEWKIVNVTISNLIKADLKGATIHIVSDSNILEVWKEIPVDSIDGDKWNGNFSVNAVFIGKANVFVVITYSEGQREESQTKLPIVITRPERLIDTLFIISVAALVSILYINFGAALDLQKVKGVLLKPIGPAIAFFCHFIFLPLVSDLKSNKKLCIF